MEYLILLHPGHSRVYFEESRALSLAEFGIAAPRFGAGCLSFGPHEAGGIGYLRFATREPLGERDRALVARLSFAYALFELRADSSLLPQERGGERYCDDSIVTILKYTGKTNELFTRMLVNLATWSGAYAEESRLSLLDPVAGKGTTLFEGLSAGYDTAGIEIGTKVTAEAAAYLRKYLETGRFKFSQKVERVSGDNRSFTAQRYHFEIARSKADTEARTLTMVAGPSAHADRYFRKNTFHLLVGDLPYGVQHGAVTQEKQDGLTRDAARLLHACLPAWRAVLRPGAALALAFNTLTTRRADIEDELRTHGFTVLDSEPYRAFAHRVDSSILRDVVVALR
ncbi:MAG: hypothetical protein KBA30_04960 [Clostridia bacterium]|nr:hypothetical protein [Clostridia bacterium]